MVTRQEDAVRLMIEKFSGRLLPEDERILNAWLDASNKNRAFYEDAMRVWLLSPAKTNHPEPATNEEWLRLVEILDKRPVPLRPKTAILFAIAATLTLTIIVGVFVIGQRNQIVTFATSEKEELFILPDSSSVVLKPHSEISYSADFGVSDRRIRLGGNGSFAVKEGVIPFIVKTSLVDIKVLGTTFDVVTNDTLCMISVRTGRVNVSSAEASVDLLPGDRGWVNLNKQIIKTNARQEQLDSERNNPGKYLEILSSSRKNLVVATVADGAVVNHATFTTFANIELALTYQKDNGKTATTYVKIDGPLFPGRQLSFHKRLNNAFSKSHLIDVRLSKVDVAAQPN